MITKINGIHYAYDVQGNGEPFLLLHGFTSNRQQWAEIVNALSSQYTCITVDLIGHGETDAPTDYHRYAMEHAAQDLIKLMQHIDYEKFHLLGYSMGGRLALYTAIHYPENILSLILESTSPGLQTEKERDQRRERDNALAEQIIEKGIEWFAEYWDTLSLWNSQKSLPQHILDNLNIQRLQNTPLGLANSLRGMGTGVQPSLWDKLNTLQMPVSLVVGEYDSKFTEINKKLSIHIPKVQLHTIPDAGHNTHLAKPIQFIKNLRNT